MAIQSHPISFVPHPRAPGVEVDAQGLERALRRAVSGEVRFDAGSRALYATDASNYRQVPIGVVIPRSRDDVLAVVEACRRYGAPLLARGGGTSLAGQCCNVAVVLDFSKYLNRILELDPQAKRARVEPGVVLDRLRDAAERHHLTFAPDPSTHSHNTLGGMIGNNSCGVHSVMGGKTVDNVIALDVLTYDGQRLEVGRTDDAALAAKIAAGGRIGELYAGLRSLRDEYAEEIRARYPRIPRRVSGYNLDELLPENGFDVARALVGSEGTCVTLLEATVRLVDSPPGRVLLVLGYPDVFAAGDHVPDVLAQGPIGLEGIDRDLVEDMRALGLHAHDLGLLPHGHGWLLAEFGGADRDEAAGRARGCMRALSGGQGAPQMRLIEDPRQQRKVWKIRESGLGATAHVPGKEITWEGWEDAAVPPERVGDYLREFRALLDRYEYVGDLYGHFGDGCIHTRIDFDLASRPGVEKYRRFIDEAADLVLRFGGSLSGEHGDGQSRGALLPKMFGPRLIEAFRRFKRLWDPDGRMNPGKLIDAWPPDENLRLQAPWHPPPLDTHFRYPKDRGDFARVALRCVGVGNCRQEHGQTMCPSYRATREEMHSTRGRARLMFEMLRGEVLGGGWADEHVREALSLCLSCKGCKSDCPVHVDMATYKAEFMSHYHEHRRRPRTAYAFGRIQDWARLASLAPALANVMAQSPLTGRLVKAAAGIDPARSLPRFARKSFVDGFRPKPANGAERVLLWPDTFNNFFHPGSARAAAKVLEQGGCQVTVPRRPVCCGRPLYEFGMLSEARQTLSHTLEVLAHDIAAGTPMVVLEPACASVFRDELTNLFPDDAQAKKLAGQTFFFDEFVAARAGRFRFRHLGGEALVHAHCHRKALLGDNGPRFDALGIAGRVLDSGCCGMAGSFGFEAEKTEVSRRIGEAVLLPAVRAAGPETWIVADGFSCREQIRQHTDRRALHPAELMAMALEPKPATLPAPAEKPRLPLGTALLATGALLAGTFALSRR